MFTTGVEFNAAIVDLIISVVLIPLVIILIKTKSENIQLKNKWIHLIGLTALSNFSGAIVHIFKMDELVKDIIWIFLYPMMYNLIVSLLFLSINKISNFNKPNKKFRIIIFISAIIFDLISTILGFYLVKNVLVFTIYASIVGIPSLTIFIILGLKYNDKSSKFMFAVFPILLVGAIAELLRNISFKFIIEIDHNIIFHLCLLISMILIFFTALIDIKGKNSDIELD